MPLENDTTFGDGNLTGGNVRVTSEEINILIYLYLLESNFQHTAFTLLSESDLPSAPLFQKLNPTYPAISAAHRNLSQTSRQNGQAKSSSHSEPFGAADGKIGRGELIRKLWKALRWEEIERHTEMDSVTALACRSPFHLIVPHTCSLDDGTLLVPPPSSPPPKRPEAFPEPYPDASMATTEADSPLVRQDESSPLTSGKGKRKSSETSAVAKPSATETQSRGTSPGAAAADGKSATASEVEASPAAKRPRDGNGDSSKSEGGRASIKVKLSRGVKGPHSEALSTENGVWSEHRDSVTCLAWNPKDQEVLVTGSNDGTARLWHFSEPNDGSSHALRLSQKPSSISHKSIDSGKKAVTALVWHPDGTVFATASDGVGRLFTPSGQLQGILTYGRGAINSLKFNPSGTSLLAAKDDFTVCLFVLDFDLKSPKQLSFESHTKEVNDVDWLDDDVFASGGNDHTIFIYRSNDRRPRFTLRGHSDDVTRVKWSPPRQGQPDHQRLLASVSDDGSILIWKLPHYPADRGTVSRSLSPNKQPKDKEPSTDDIFQMTVSPGSEYCVNRLQVVNAGTENKRMSTLEWGPTCKDGKMIVAAGGQDSTVRLFDATSGECLHTLPGLELGTGSLAFAPVVNLTRPWGVLAGGGWNGKLILWDVHTGTVLRECEVDEELERQSARDRPMMMAMAWRHDAQQLAVGLHNKSLMTTYVGSLL